jgi:hypothetical protein
VLSLKGREEKGWEYLVGARRRRRDQLKPQHLVRAAAAHQSSESERGRVRQTSETEILEPGSYGPLLVGPRRRVVHGPQGPPCSSATASTRNGGSTKFWNCPNAQRPCPSEIKKEKTSLSFSFARASTQAPAHSQP